MIRTAGADRICIRFQVLRWLGASSGLARTDWAWLPAEFVALAYGVGDRTGGLLGRRGRATLTS